MKNRKVDAYIEKSYINGKTEYNMWLHYNGIDFAFLTQNPEAALFAQYIKRKMLPVTHSTEGLIFTTPGGWSIDKNSDEALLAGVKGIEAIDKSIMTLISGCTNLDIQSDLTIHIDDEEFGLVRNADGVTYKTNDMLGLSQKGLSFDILSKLDRKIASLPEETKKHNK